MIVQKELQMCVQDVDKTKKLYFDEEHSAHDVRDKAKDIEEKCVHSINTWALDFYKFHFPPFQTKEEERILLSVHNIVAKE